jgi:hypothetical protein
LNAEEEGWLMVRQKWSKPWKEEFRPPPHNWSATVTTTTATLSKEKTHLHELHIPCLECLKKKKAKELRWWLKPWEERECDRPTVQQRWKRRKNRDWGKNHVTKTCSKVVKNVR